MGNWKICCTQCNYFSPFECSHNMLNIQCRYFHNVNVNKEEHMLQIFRRETGTPPIEHPKGFMYIDIFLYLHWSNNIPSVSSYDTEHPLDWLVTTATAFGRVNEKIIDWLDLVFRKQWIEGHRRICEVIAIDLFTQIFVVFMEHKSYFLGKVGVKWQTQQTQWRVIEFRSDQQLRFE